MSIEKEAQEAANEIEAQGRESALRDALQWCLEQRDGELSLGNVRELVLIAYAAGFSSGKHAAEKHASFFGVYL